MTHPLAAFVLVLPVLLLAPAVHAQGQGQIGVATEPATAAAESPAQQTQQVPPVEEVQVRARRPQVQGSQRSISGKEAALVPGAGSDSIKALQTLPGVVSVNDASAEPAVRGSRPTDNAYLVDFAPVGYLFHAGGLVSVLPGELVQRFDLHSAAFGPQFADVTGAVIDVTLRDPRSDALHGKLDASFLAGGLVLEGPLAPGHSLLVAARRSYLDWLIGEQTDDNSGVITQLPRYRDYQLKYLWEPDAQQRLSLHLNGANDHISYSVPPDSTLGQQEPVFIGAGHNDTAYDSASLQWERDWGGGTRHRLALGRLQTRLDSQTGSAVDLSARVQTRYLRAEMQLRPAAQHELWLGADASRSEVRLALDMNNPRCTEFEPDCDYTGADPLSVRQRLTLDEQALHVRERWQFHPDWALTTGLRYSRDAYLDEAHLEPRLGLEWAWTADTRFSAGWGLHNQQPAGVQILEGLGNPALRHLRARHTMLGMSQRLDAQWNWRVEVYDKRLDQLVLADERLNYLNGGSGRAWGAELLLRKETGQGAAWWDRLSGWMSLSWARSVRHNEVTGERFAFEFDQPLIVNLVGRWKQSERVSFGARWSLHSGSLYTPITGGYTDAQGRIRPVYAGLNSARLPTYHRLDLRLDYRFNPRLTGYLELINAYGRENVSGYAYSADYSQRTAETQLPRLTSVGVQWEF